MQTAPGVAAEPTFIDILTAWSTLGAAIATTISVIFIAVQIWYTRRSVESTATALEIARDEFAHGQLLRHDSHRAAIDAEMPRLTIEVLRQSESVWRTDETTPDPYSEEAMPDTVPVGSEFTVPRNNGIPLGVGCLIRITNDGPRRAVATLWHEGGSTTLALAPGDKATQWLKRTQPLSEWVAIAKDRENGEAGEQRVVATLSYTYPGDVGADETHEVLQGGTLVERVPDNAAGWRTVDPSYAPGSTTGLNVAAQPFMRTYWASRREGRRLEPPKEGA